MENEVEQSGDGELSVAAEMGVELIYYGQLGLTSAADRILAEYGYGRAHFRALYVIARHPGITTSGILAQLKITNQSLARVMGQLVRERAVFQEAAEEDRRHRKHYLTDKGRKLEDRVLRNQTESLERSYREAGPGTAAAFLRVLHALMPEEDRRLLSRPIADIDDS